mgnify:CR=1 FL=1
MRYFLDTEFAEKPNTIDLISIAIVADDGREFYAESADFNVELANDFVRQNVLPALWSRQADKAPPFNAWIRDGGTGGLMPTRRMGSAIARFIGDDTPEFWGYYCDYDWVATCWLFGAMVDLPPGWPMYCRDIKQLCDSKGNPKLPGTDSHEHHALHDARWNRTTLAWLEAS